MNYLKNLDEGKTATIISSIKLANENYSICLNLLKEDKQLTIQSRVSKLLKLENITSVNVSGLKKLFHAFDIQVRSLKNLITSEIPGDLNLIINRKFDSAIILNALKTEITARGKTIFVRSNSHVVKDCCLKIKYFKCSKRHHVALCDLKESGHSSNSSSVANIYGVDCNTNIVLQTAKVKMNNCENSYVNLARVLFDRCSQLSYITPQLRNRSFGNNC